MMKQNVNVQQQEQEQFALTNEPTAYVISVHMRNMMATYGEDTVKNIIKELFFTAKSNGMEVGENGETVYEY